jgi:hypothetical protein
MVAGGLFRGTELPRLLILLGLLLVGWPLACYYAGRPSAPEPRPAPIAEQPPLPPADESPAFAGLLDKTTLTVRDTPAYAELLQRARRTPGEILAARSRRDVSFRELVQRPARYRGLPIHIEGTAFQIYRVDDVSPDLSPQGHLHEAWVVPADGPSYPYCVVFETPPQGLPGGRDLREYVGFDGYFLKLLAYEAGDTPRFAPLLVGRLGWSPPGAEGASPDQAEGFDQRWMLGILLVLMLVSLMRWGLMLRRRSVAGSRSSRPPLPRSETIEPAELEAFLNNPPPGENVRPGSP